MIHAGNYQLISTGGVIPSTNGFFVKASDATNSITIPASARFMIHKTTIKMELAAYDDETLFVTVNNDANNYYDQNRIGFNAEATNGYDLLFDAHKLFGKATAPQLWTTIDGESLLKIILHILVQKFTCSFILQGRSKRNLPYQC